LICQHIVKHFSLGDLLLQLLLQLLYLRQVPAIVCRSQAQLLSSSSWAGCSNFLRSLDVCKHVEPRIISIYFLKLLLNFADVVACW